MDWRLRAVLVVAVLGATAGLVIALVPRSVTPETAFGAPHFVEETASAGVDQVYDGDAAFQVGGGVAVFDCDADGRPDLYIAGGAHAAALFHNESATGGALRFARVTDPVTDLTSVNGAYPIDIDGDGHTDLVVLRNGESLVLRGLGGCRFEPTDVRVMGMTEAFSATWQEPNGRPTLAFGRYLQAGTYDCDTNVLLRPSENRYTESVLEPGYCALSMLFSDWDRSGRRDLRVSNDRQYYTDGQEQLWRMQSGVAPRQYTADDGWVSMQIWGMGIASYDLLGTGYPEVFLTSQGDNKLQTLTTGPAQPTYRDIALRRGVLAAQPFAGGEHLPSTAWHPQFEDVNNDGFIDLFVSKGNVGAQTGYATRDPSNLLIGQADGTFKEAAEEAGVLNFGRGRGAALADFNLDGALDLVEVNYGDPVRIWRNTSSMGNWIGVRLSQAGGNRDAIGAWIEVQVGSRILRRELTVGGGHGGGELGPVHFGVGQSRTAQVRVQWPDGDVGPWRTVDVNQYLVIAR